MEKKTQFNIWYFIGVDQVHKVSIIPRGIGSLGYTIQRPTEDRYLMTQRELENKIAVLLGGRAAEKLVFGHLSTGASDDMAKSTDIARSMVTRYGMDENLGYVTYEDSRPKFLDLPGAASQPDNLSEATRNSIDEAVRQIIKKVFDNSYEILKQNRAVLDRCAKALLEKETLDESQLLELTKDLARDGETSC